MSSESFLAGFIDDGANGEKVYYVYPDDASRTERLMLEAWIKQTPAKDRPRPLSYAKQVINKVPYQIVLLPKEPGFTSP